MTNMSLTCALPPAAFISCLARSLTAGRSQNAKYKEMDRDQFILKPAPWRLVLRECGGLDNTEVVELDKDKGGVGGARAGREH